MNSNRNEVVSTLINKWQKLDRQSIPGDLSRYIRKMSKDNRYSNQSILKMFPKTVLLDNFVSLYKETFPPVTGVF